MARLFQRVCAINVDTLQITGLRICFNVKKTLTKDPNTLDAKIYNLSEKTRSTIKKRGAKIALAAGYPGETSLLFSGDARTIDHTHDGPDWVTHIQCGDGETAFRFATISESFSPGTLVKDAIHAAATALGLNKGNLEDALASGNPRQVTQFLHGYTAHGKASGELDKLLKSAGFSWSIQNGALQVLKGNTPAKGEAILLSPDTGMIGSPDHGTPEKAGQPAILKIKSLLKPTAKCGGVISVQSFTAKGQYRTNQLEHAGDTAGGDWFTHFEAIPL